MKTYKEFYFECQRAFNPEGFSDALYSHTIAFLKPGEESSLFKFPANWNELIRATKEKIDMKFQDSSNHYRDPLDNIPGSYSEGLLIKLKLPYDVPEIEQICQAILPQLERSLFNSHITVTHAHIYRNVVSDKEESSSFIPHYDNTPKECLKVLIYLDDTDEQNGSMRYLRHSQTGEAIKFPTSRVDKNTWTAPYYPGNRIPKDILEQLYQRGYSWESLNGPAGSVIVFDNNVAHAATKNKAGTRDVLNLLIRPIDRKLERYITPELVGGFEKQSPNPDPETPGTTNKND